MLSVADAQAAILERIRGLPVEEVPLAEATERALGRDVVAPRALPPFDNSAVDGYAIRARDWDRPLSVVGTVGAGSTPTTPVRAGQALRIMTGAPVPRSADAIAMVEHCRLDGGRLTIDHEARAGDHVRRSGSDLRSGSMALRRGVPLLPGELGLLAALGVTKVPVHRRPRVAIVATGNELVPVGTEPGIGQIVNSSSVMLAAQVRACGGVPVDVGIARDDPDALRERLARALTCDFVLTTGGVSVGDFDYVKQVLEGLGLEMAFWKVRMKPGKPLAFGLLHHKPVFGLPGNPVSSAVTFEVFVRPALLKAQGHLRLFRPVVRAPIAAPQEGSENRTHFLRARLLCDRDGRLHCEPLRKQRSDMLTSLCEYNALAVIDAPRVELGDAVDVWMLDLPWPET